MSNTLMVHIGTPKTGTTALQQFLADNREQLKKYGWCYPHLTQDWAVLNKTGKKDFLAKNANLLKFSISQNWPEKEKKALWDIIHGYLQNYNVILSDEGMWSNFEVNMEEIRTRYDKVKIICYLRRQDLFFESKWNQGVKATYFDGDVQDLYNLKHEEVEYKKRMDYLSNMFGKENVIVRVYEKGQFGGARGDITSDFLEACGIESAWEEAVLPGHINERIDNDALGLKHLYNKEYMKTGKKQVFDSCGQIVKKHFLELSLSDNNKKMGYIPQEERLRMLEKFRQENEYIAREYLGREDGRLFYDLNVDIPLYTPEFSKREQQIVKLFAGIISEREKSIMELEKKQAMAKKKPR